MAMRTPSRCLFSSMRNVGVGRRHMTSTAPASSMAGSNLSAAVQDEIQREASLPTPDPAPDSATAALVNDQMKYLVATYVRPMPMFVKGEGCYLWDLENRRYLDMTAGIAVTSLGHCDPEMNKILYQQSRLLVHTSNLYHQPWVGSLSKLIVTKTVEAGGMRGASKVFICNSGTEANEAALKFARKVGKVLQPDGSKHEIVSFTNSFHGRTWGALSATPNAKYQKPFAPMVGGFRHGRFNDVAGLDALVTERTCGVIVEPIQGEGGINVATPQFLTALRKRCDDVGAVLIYDEIQCGLSRTGELWAHQLYSSSYSSSSSPSTSQSSGPHPDILTTAKALGNGYPIGATVVNDFVAEKIVTGDHGTTFGGNPLGCRLAHHIFERLSDPALQSTVRERGRVLRGHLEKLQTRFPDLVGSVSSDFPLSSSSPSSSSSFSSSSSSTTPSSPLSSHSPSSPSPSSSTPSSQASESNQEPLDPAQGVDNARHDVIRGHGLIQGLQLKRDPTPIIQAARERGLLLLTCGLNTLRFVPPLIIEDEHLHEGMHILGEAMQSVLHRSEQ